MDAEVRIDAEVTRKDAEVRIHLAYRMDAGLGWMLRY